MPLDAHRFAVGLKCNFEEDDVILIINTLVKLVELNLRGCKITDKAGVELIKLGHLQKLYLDECDITVITLEKLAVLESLSTLSLDRCSRLTEGDIFNFVYHTSSAIKNLILDSNFSQELKDYAAQTCLANESEKEGQND